MKIKKYAVLLLTLFLCACQNVNAVSSVVSAVTSSARSSTVLSAPMASDAVESKYQDHTGTIYETEKYIYIYEKNMRACRTKPIPRSLPQP